MSGSKLAAEPLVCGPGEYGAVATPSLRVCDASARLSAPNRSLLVGRFYDTSPRARCPASGSVAVDRADGVRVAPDAIDTTGSLRTREEINFHRETLELAALTNQHGQLRLIIRTGLDGLDLVHDHHRDGVEHLAEDDVFSI